MRKLLFLLLAAVLLCGTAVAYEVPQDFTDLTLEEAITEFREYYQLTEDNFSLSYYNTVTKESYDFNEYHFAIAASTYKLPLNMYFYELEAKGEIDPNEMFRHTGMTLAQVHEQSIQYSNNEVSEAMTGYWINYYEYKKAMLKYSAIADEDIPESFYLTNHSCTKIMMDTLKYLYEREDEFAELIGYMKLAMPGEYFQAGVSEYEVAHKYGQVDEFINDVAIIYTPQPILLAVYTQGTYGTGICAEAARLVTNYTVWNMKELSVNEVVGNYSTLASQMLGNVRSESAEAEDAAKETVEADPNLVPQSGIAKEVTSFVALAAQKVQEYREDPSVLETWTEEMPEPEVPAEEAEQPEDEKVPVKESKEDKRKPEQSEYQIEEEEENKAIWVIVGVGSLLLLVAIPVLLRKRY